jgi:hypothetical protein
MSLADAQRWFDGAPDLTLSPLFMQSVVSQVLHDRWEQWQALLRDRLTGLVYSADALALTDAGWSEPARVVGLDGDPRWMDTLSVVRSDDLDAGHVVGPWCFHGWEEGPPPTDSVVYDVWPDWRGLGHSEFRRVRQGTVRSDACLDGRELSVQQFQTRHELWCDSADHEWESSARNRGN